MVCEEADQIMACLFEDGMPDAGLLVPLKYGFRLIPRERPNATIFVPYPRSGLDQPDALCETDGRQVKGGQVEAIKYNKSRPAFFPMDGTFASRGTALKVKTDGYTAATVLSLWL